MHKTSHNPTQLLTTKQAANYLAVSPQFLSQDRFQANQAGTSPKIPYVKLSERIVRYREDDLCAHLEKSRRV